jgi:uncharacterized membrane protein
MPKFSNDNAQYSEFYEQLKQREQQWWRACQRFTMLKERQMFLFGDNSLIMWLLWQFVSFVVVAILLMLMSKLLNISTPLWQYMAVLGFQIVFFVVMFSFKDQLANHLQSNINNTDLAREQALNEMVVLANDSIFPDIHAHTPISLQHIHDRYEAQLRLASLQCLLQKEVDAGRLLLGKNIIEARALPPELADDELTPYAGEMIYKSMI